MTTQLTDSFRRVGFIVGRNENAQVTAAQLHELRPTSVKSAGFFVHAVASTDRCSKFAFEAEVESTDVTSNCRMPMSN